MSPRLNLLYERVRRETDRDGRYAAPGITFGIWLAMAVFAPDFAQGAMTKIGFLSPTIAPMQAAPNAALEAFSQGLAELGYIDGRDFTIEARWGAGRDDELPILAAELVGQKVDILV